MKLKLKNSTFSYNSINYLVAEFFNKGIVFLTIPIFTHLLEPKDYGVIAIYSAVINIFVVFMGLNLHTSVARRFHEKENNFNEFLGSNILFIGILNVFLVSLLYANKEAISTFFTINSDVFFIAVIVSSLSVFLQIHLSYLQTSQQSKKYAITMVIRNVFLITGAIFWIYFLKDDKYLGKVYSELVVMIFVFLFVFYDILKISKFTFKKEYIKYSLLYGGLLIPHSLAGLILLQADRIIINQVSGSYQTGLYSFAFNVGMIMSVVVTSFNSAWLPIFYKHLKNTSYDNIQNEINKYVKIIFTITFVLSLFSKEIVMIMADKKYYDSLKIVPIIIVSFAVVYIYTIYANYAFYKKKAVLISLFTVIAGIVNIILNYLYIPIYGYVAAAWSTLFSYIILLLLHYLNARFILKEQVIKLSSIIIQFILISLLIIFYFNLEFKSYIDDFATRLLLIFILLYIYFGKSFLITKI